MTGLLGNKFFHPKAGWVKLEAESHIEHTSEDEMCQLRGGS